MAEDGDGQEQGTMAPAVVHVQLGGKIVEVTPAVAEALYAEQRIRYTQTQHEAAALRDQAQQATQRPVAQEAQDPDLAFFQSPTAQVRHIVNEARQEVVQYMQEEERKRKFQEELRSFRSGIFRAHPALVETAGLVDYVLNEKFQEIAPLHYTVSEREAGTSRAQQIIVEAVYTMLGRAPNGAAQQRTVLPAGAARTAQPRVVGGNARPAEEESEPPRKSVGSIIKERQRQRELAARRGAA